MVTFKGDVATVLCRRTVKLLLHSGLKLQEMRATAYQTPRLNDRWVDGCAEPIISMASAVCRWYVFWETISSKLHPCATYQALCMHANI